MEYLGDHIDDQTVDLTFNTHVSGTPTTLGGTPVVKVYKANATGTEVTTGVTLTVDHDGMTGSHHVRIVTTDTFYATGNDYFVKLTAGTVGGNSVVGTVLAQFSIENRTQKADVTKWNGTTVPTPDTAGYPKVTVKSGTGAGEIVTSGGAGNANVVNIEDDVITNSTIDDATFATLVAKILGVKNVVFAAYDGNATTSGTALRAAVEGATSGTLIMVEPGTYYVGTSALAFPAGVHVRGFNREVTVIVSGAGSGVTSFVLPNLGTLENHTLYNNSSGHVLGLTGTQTVSNALVRGVRLLGQADHLHVTSSVASALTLDNAILRGTTTGSGILSSGAAHEYRLTDVQVLAFGSSAVAGINLAGAANVRGERVKVELPDASGGLAIKVAGTSQARLSDVRLKAATANVNIVDGTAGVTLIGGEFDRSLVTGVAASLTDVFSPLRPTTLNRTLDVAATGEAGVDLSNIKQATGATTLTNIVVPTVTTVTNSTSTYLATGTLASATSITATLDAGAVATADFYVGSLLVLTGGTGAGQERVITAYNGSRQATVATWGTTPDNTTTYQVRTGRSSATVTGGGDASATNQATIIKLIQAQR